MAELHKRRVRLAVDMLEASNRLERTPYHEIRNMLRQAAAMLVQNWQAAPEQQEVPANGREPAHEVAPTPAPERAWLREAPATPETEPAAAVYREPVLDFVPNLERMGRARHSLVVTHEAAPTPAPERARPRETPPAPRAGPAAAVHREPVVDFMPDLERVGRAGRTFAVTPAPAYAWRAGTTVDAVPSLERVFTGNERARERPARRLNWPLFAVSFAAGLGGPAAAILIFRNGTALADATDWLSVTLFGFVAVEAVFGVIAARVLWPLWKQRGWGLLTDLFRADET